MKTRWFLLLWFIPLLGVSQEALLSEPSQACYLSKSPFPSYSLKRQSLTLPFFDDFYQYDFEVNPVLWQSDTNVQVHFGIGKYPPNRGVVVLDGALKNGQGYAEISSYGIQERLLSQPIDLSTLTPADSLYLSFFFMHGGYGDKAESTDSLKLYFLDSTQTPHLVWFRTGGDTMQSFSKVILPITDPQYFHSQFQFYFESYGSLNGFFDQWLLDYIYLNQNRNYQDTLFSDLSFSDRRYSLFDSLMAIPLKQFQSKAWMSSGFIEVTNLSANNEGRNLTWSIQETKHQTALNPPLSQNQFFAFFPSYTAYPIPAFSEQTTVLQNYGQLQVTFALNYNASDPQVLNDTLNLTFPVDTVLAYDDGEAEAGYGLRAAKTFVQKFYNFTQDSLKAVQILFVPNLDIISGKGFKLVILHQLHRDSVLYSKFYNLQHLPKRDSFNYFLLDSILPLPSVYYIGITQPDNKPIGVGFDFSYNHNHNIFWDSSSVFVPSRLNGTLMIRPVMGSKPELMVSRDAPLMLEPSVFPNPVQRYFYLQSPVPISKIEIFNVLGELVQVVEPSEQVNVEHLPAGSYYLKLYSEQRNSVWIQKIMKLP